MLKAMLTKNHAGILLIGDYESLREAHRILHDVNDRSALIKDQEGQLMSLAYDIRKAYERQRETLEPPEHYPEIGSRYGVHLLWPQFLYQARLLREALAFMDHGKPHQVVAYTLEAIIEAALAEDFPKEHRTIQQLWAQVTPQTPGLEERVLSRCAAYSRWAKTERRTHFAELLRSLNPVYDVLKQTAASRSQGTLPAGYFDRFGDDDWADIDW